MSKDGLVHPRAFARIPSRVYRYACIRLKRKQSLRYLLDPWDRQMISGNDYQLTRRTARMAQDVRSLIPRR